MKNCKLWTVLLILAFLSTMVFTGCGGNQQAAGDKAAAPAQKYTLSMSLGGTTGIYYIHGAALAEVVVNNSKSLTLIPSTSGGGTENLRNVTAKKMEIGIAPLSDLIHAWRADDMFAKDAKADNLRYIGPGEQPIGFQIIALNRSKISKPEDLVGKKVVLGAPGSTARTMGEYMFKELGILEKINLTNYGQEELPTRLQDGDIDAFGVMANVPAPRITGIAAIEPVTIVDFSEAMAKTDFLKKYPFVSFPIKAGSYRGHDADATSYGVLPVWFTHKDVPEEAIYEFMKQTYEPEGIKALTATFKDHDHDRPDPLDVLAIPLHPGAEKYWKEKGVNIPQPSEVK